LSRTCGGIMAVPLKIAKLLEILSTEGRTTRAELMQRMKIKDENYFMTILSLAREEVGIYTLKTPSGVISYQINYSEEQ
jgi:hypothetical protein